MGDASHSLALLFLLAVATPTNPFLAGIKCSSCQTLAPMVVGLVRLTQSSEMLRAQGHTVCRLLPVSDIVCRGFIDSWATAVTHMLVHSELSGAQLCSIFLELCPAGASMDIDITLDLPRPPAAGWTRRRHRHYPAPSTPGLKVLHIADLHLDLLYHAGADNNCSDELCCRPEYGFPVQTERRAGFWGDYTKCDTPPRLLHSMVNHIARRHKDDLAYILWTGDNVPHDSWRSSRHDVLAVTANVTALLRRRFRRTAVIPVIGNHDSAPCNYFPPLEMQKGNFSNSWVYHAFAKMWKHWLPSGALKTLRRSGYYSVLVRPGLRVIVLNTNVAYRYNLWVLVTARSDPHHQLKWLAGQLRSARSAGEKCHVTGHVSPADPDILPAWSHLYHKIIRSYQDTVTAQFFSHTHLNEIQVYKDNSDRPFSVSYIAPSATPWKNVNPGYRIYTIDGARGNDSTWEVCDYERWVTDLADANRNARRGPHWHRQISAARRYHLRNLSPTHWSRMVNKMLLTGRLFDRYHRDLSGAATRRGDCDISCRLRNICDIVTSDRSNSLHCSLVKRLYKMGTAIGLS